MELDHFVTQARARRNVDLVGLITLLEIARLHLFKAVKTRFALRLAAFSVAAYPLKLLLDGFLTRRFLFGFLGQALLFLLKPLGVVAFKRNALAAVQLKNPARDVIQEVTVVGNRNDRAVVVVQEALQPRHGFSVQVVGGLVQQ